MKYVVAYGLVIALGQFCLTFGSLAIGFAVALCLAWASISLRTKIAGVCAGIAGIALAVAFGYGVFRFVVGPESFTVFAFLASTIPLLYSVWSDFQHARRVATARNQMLDTFTNSRGEQVTKQLAAQTENASGSAVIGEIVGLALAAAWFFSR